MNQLASLSQKSLPAPPAPGFIVNFAQTLLGAFLKQKPTNSFKVTTRSS